MSAQPMKATHSVSYWVPLERYWQIGMEGSLKECRERASYLGRYHAKVRVRKLKSWSAD